MQFDFNQKTSLGYLKNHAKIYNRYRLRFFYQVGHQTTYASMGNKHFIAKKWTELTKIGHIFRKQSTLKIKVFKKSQL